MIPLLRFYIFTFLKLGLFFAPILVFLFFDNSRPTSSDLYVLLIWAIMFLLMITAHVLKLMFDGVRHFDNSTLTMRQKRDIPLHLSMQEMIAHLQNDPFFGKQNMHETIDGIDITTGISWWSWGEKITAHLYNTSTGDKHLKISSRPRLFTTLIDYEMNRRNIDRFERLINAAQRT